MFYIHCAPTPCRKLIERYCGSFVNVKLSAPVILKKKNNKFNWSTSSLYSLCKLTSRIGSLFFFHLVAIGAYVTGVVVVVVVEAKTAARSLLCICVTTSLSTCHAKRRIGEPSRTTTQTDVPFRLLVAG